MSDPSGFLKYNRKNNPLRPIKNRIKDFNEIEQNLGEKDRRQQAARCMNCGIPFCHHGIFFDGKNVGGCPNNNLIPEWQDLVYQKQDKLAFDRLTLTNPLAEFTGLVCPAPCEISCNEALHGNGIAIRNNEHYIIENAFKNGWVEDQGKPKQRNNIPIAIIGSGPAGLAAAWRFNQLGYSVSIFEKEDRPGGLLMYGIPNMHLPKNMVTRRIKVMKNIGIKFYLNSEIGNNISIKDLEKNFTRIVVCIGAQNPRELKVKGRKLKGIKNAVDFLSDTTRHVLLNDKNIYHHLKGKRVLVIGGGDTANDCIGTSVREGASEVHQLIRRPEPLLKRTPDNPWPEDPKIKKVDYGQAEAEEVFKNRVTEYQRCVTSFKGKNGYVSQAVVSKAKNRKPIENTGKPLKVDLVLLALGFSGPEPSYMKKFGIKTKSKDYSTNKEQIYIAGDARRGSSLVIWALHEGRMVAKATVDSLRKLKKV